MGYAVVRESEQSVQPRAVCPGSSRSVHLTSVWHGPYDRFLIGGRESLAQFAEGLDGPVSIVQPVGAIFWISRIQVGRYS